MKYAFTCLLMAGLFAFGVDLRAQVATCDPTVPYNVVNLVGQPAGTWTSPVHSRQGNCCSASGSDRCTSFEILLDTGAAMITFEIATGSIPPGAMFYQINCGPQVAVGQPICVVGPGPHYLTFCKPGNNTNTYRVTSIPRPTFPGDQTSRFGCSLPLNVLGLVESSITWNSVFPGAPGAYNSYLSCTTACDSVMYVPAAGAPAFIDYVICGTPIATACGLVALCDTIRVYNSTSVTASVSPVPATFCGGGPGVTLTATASGGQGPYIYTWYTQSLNVAGVGNTLNVTSGGTYQLRVEDAIYDSTYCPATLLSVPVTEVQPPAVNAGANQTLCANAPAATLQGTVTNATGGNWTGGAGTFNPGSNSLVTVYTPTAAEVLAGQVTLTLTSTGAGGGCVNATDNITLFFPPLLTASLASQTISCNGGNATLSPVVSGGTQPYSYLWNTGISSSSINTGAGNYCVAVTDNLGCNTNVCANVTEPTLLTSTISSVDATTNGGTDGSATVTASGGTGPYSYLWSPSGQTTATASGLSYGVHSVIVTDANGCTTGASVVVNEPRCLGFQVTALSTNLECHGDNDATGIAIVSGGTAPYTFSWNTSPAQTNFLANNLPAGTWFVTVTEASGCIDVASATVNEPPALVNTMNSTNTSAVAATDGSVTANPSGGTAPYEYQWNTSDTTASITNLSAGIYIVTITDANGCSLTDSIRIYDPQCASIVMNTYSTSVTCPGGNDGTASALVLFDAPPYTYTWSNGGTTPSISGLNAGTYTVVGSGALNCMHFANITVTQPSPLSVAVAPTSSRCNNANDGTIDLTVSGGTYPYTYAWSNGVFVEDQENLSPGTYSVTITDANGCMTTASATINEPSQLSITSVISDVACHGGNEGAIDVSVSGGAGPYTYAWSNGATTQDISTLTFGTYVLTVTDANNCNSPAIAIPVNEPSVVTLDSMTTACPVPGSGVAEVTVYSSGGNSGQYQISFDNGATFLPAGVYTTFLPVDSTYYVLVNDAAGCATISPDTLIVAPAVEILTVSYDPCIADGVTSIAVNTTLIGGSSSLLQLSVDNGNTFLPAGTYTTQLATNATHQLVAQDSLGCLSTVEVVTLSDEIILTGSVSSFIGGAAVSCAGAADGSIDLAATGGTGSYTYNWSNGATSEDVAALSSGTFSVIVTDSLSCNDTIAFTLTAPQTLTAAANVTSNFNGYAISCAGNSDGVADLNVNGGTAGYSYLWSNGATSEDLSNVAAGVYSVLITDANNCTANDTITLTEPTALAASATAQNVLCNAAATGTADLSVSGGVSGYTFLWNNSATAEDINALAAGTYSVTITDANACTTTASLTITEPAAISLTGITTDLTCYQSANGSIDLSAAGGIVPYTFTWNNAAVTEDITNLSAGNYSVLLTDSAGCADSISFTINEPDSLTATAVATSDFNGYDVSCAGSNNGTADLTVTGGTTGYTFAWSNSGSTEDLSNLAAGTYSVQITDANGCLQSATVTLTAPPALNITATQQNVPCNGFFTGSIDLSVNGGVQPLTYLWSNNAVTEDISNLGAGTYSVTTTDANGCTIDSTFTISESSPVLATAASSNPLCFGETNGSSTVSINGGTAPYTYTWSDGQTSGTATDLGAGVYSVIVSDSNNCLAHDTILIVNPNPLTASISSPLQTNGHNISQAGGNDGSIVLEIAGGNTPYTFLWNNGSTAQNLSGLPAGTYSVTITDVNGCTTTAAITIEDPMELAMPTGFSPNGDALNDAFVVHGLEAYTDNRFEVYNRWGNLVYAADNYMNGWRGTSDNGEALPDGTYFVILLINDGSIKLSGFVDLRR